jgi:hypothetical protein
MNLRPALLACTIILVSSVHGTDIYRWVDADGHVQFSDVVPPKYKESATKFDSRRYELSADQRREVETRFAQEKLRAEEAKRRLARAEAVAHTDEASAPVTVPSTPPTFNEKADCATQYRLYLESVACFAP